MSSMKLITVAIAALFLLVVSAVLRFSELYIMSAAVASVPIASYLVGRIVVRNLRCSREVPHFAREDEPFRVSLHLHGKSGLLGPMEINDVLPEWMEKAASLADLPSESDGVLTATYTATSTKRGEHAIGPLKLRVSDPLGFFMFSCEYPLMSRVVVLPRPMHIPELEVRRAGSFGQYQFEGTGARGSGTDFHGVREYQPGDELRRIHWASTARHGHLNVVEFEHRRAQDTVIAIDLRRGSEVGYGRYSSLEYAIRIGAGIAEEALMLGSSARLMCAGLEGAAASPATGLDQLYIILETLAKIRADRREAISDVLLRDLDALSSDSVVTCLSACADEGLARCAQLLAPKGAKINFILINPASEVEPGPDEFVGNLVAAGASAAIVECSTEAVEGYVRYDYPA